jgi:hypothetical protein
MLVTAPLSSSSSWAPRKLIPSSSAASNLGKSRATTTASEKKNLTIIKNRKPEEKLKKDFDLSNSRDLAITDEQLELN